MIRYNLRIAFFLKPEEFVTLGLKDTGKVSFFTVDPGKNVIKLLREKEIHVAFFTDKTPLNEFERAILSISALKAPLVRTAIAEFPKKPEFPKTFYETVIDTALTKSGENEVRKKIRDDKLQIEKLAERIQQSKGIKTGNAAFSYITLCVLELARDCGYTEKVTALYDKVARDLSVTPDAVEKSIRTTANSFGVKPRELVFGIFKEVADKMKLYEYDNLPSIQEM